MPGACQQLECARCKQHNNEAPLTLTLALHPNSLDGQSPLSQATCCTCANAHLHNDVSDSTVSHRRRITAGRKVRHGPLRQTRYNWMLLSIVYSKWQECYMQEFMICQMLDLKAETRRGLHLRQRLEPWPRPADSLFLRRVQQQVGDGERPGRATGPWPRSGFASKIREGPVPQPLLASLFLRNTWLLPGVLES